MSRIIDKTRPADPNRDAFTPSVTRSHADMRADGEPGLSFEAVLAGRWTGSDFIATEMAHDCR